MADWDYILLVEDDLAVQANNKKILERRGYAIKQAYTLAQAHECVSMREPLAVVLDIELPDGSGLEFLNELRKTSDIPVLMLTALGTSEDVTQALEAGGDFYLTKPYDLKSFLSQLEALLRRASLVPAALSFGALKLVPASSVAYNGGKDMVLSKKEFALLMQFVQHPEKPLSAQRLYQKVWGQDMAGDSQAIKQAIHRLRCKLENSGCIITSQRGEGYCFERE